MKINFIVLKFLLILTFYLHINNWNLLYNKNFPTSLMRWIFIEYKVLKNTSNININNNKNNNNNYINSNEYKKIFIIINYLNIITKKIILNILNKIIHLNLIIIIIKKVKG